MVESESVHAKNSVRSAPIVAGSSTVVVGEVCLVAVCIVAAHTLCAILMSVSSHICRVLVTTRTGPAVPGTDQQTRPPKHLQQACKAWRPSCWTHTAQSCASIIAGPAQPQARKAVAHTSNTQHLHRRKPTQHQPTKTMPSRASGRSSRYAPGGAKTPAAAVLLQKPTLLYNSCSHLCSGMIRFAIYRISHTAPGARRERGYLTCP